MKFGLKADLQLSVLRYGAYLSAYLEASASATWKYNLLTMVEDENGELKDTEDNPDVANSPTWFADKYLGDENFTFEGGAKLGLKVDFGYLGEKKVNKYRAYKKVSKEKVDPKKLKEEEKQEAQKRAKDKVDTTPKDTGMDQIEVDSEVNLWEAVFDARFNVIDKSYDNFYVTLHAIDKFGPVNVTRNGFSYSFSAPVTENGLWWQDYNFKLYKKDPTADASAKFPYYYKQMINASKYNNQIKTSPFDLEPLTEYAVYPAVYTVQFLSWTDKEAYTAPTGTPLMFTTFPTMNVDGAYYDYGGENFFPRNYIHTYFERIPSKKGWHVALLYIKVSDYDNKACSDFSAVLKDEKYASKVKSVILNSTNIAQLEAKYADKPQEKLYSYDFYPEMDNGNLYYMALACYKADGDTHEDLLNAKTIQFSSVRGGYTVGYGFKALAELGAVKTESANLRITAYWNPDPVRDCQRQLIVYYKSAIDTQWKTVNVENFINFMPQYVTLNNLIPGTKYEVYVRLQSEELDQRDDLLFDDHQAMSETLTFTTKSDESPVIGEGAVHIGGVDVKERESTYKGKKVKKLYAEAKAKVDIPEEEGDLYDVFLIYSDKPANEEEAKQLLHYNNIGKGVYCARYDFESNNEFISTRRSEPLKGNRKYYFRVCVFVHNPDYARLQERFNYPENPDYYDLGDDVYAMAVHSSEISVCVTQPGASSQSFVVSGKLEKKPELSTGFIAGINALFEDDDATREKLENAYETVEKAYIEISTHPAVVAISEGDLTNAMQIVGGRILGSSKAPKKTNSRRAPEDDADNSIEFDVDLSQLNLDRYQTYAFRPCLTTVDNETYRGPLYMITPDYMGGSVVELVQEELAFVDMGLSVDWANMNLGAKTDSQYGNYYAWGEANPSSAYKQEDYNAQDVEGGTIAGSTELDAARGHLGTGCSIPTTEQWQELIDNCDWEYTTLHEVWGFKATSRKTGNTLFFPSAGVKHDMTTYDQGYCGCYWSATQSTLVVDTASGGLEIDPKEQADRMHFEMSDYADQSGMKPRILPGSKYYGRSIRAVKAK